MPEGAMPITLEQEIAQIEQDWAAKRSVLEQQKQSGTITELPHEKETLHEVVGERMGESQSIAPIPLHTSGGQTPIVLPPPTVEPPAYLSPELKEKVQELVNIAFAQTLEAAIKQARATNNPALIDAFHDALADELYNYLIERGKLKKL